MYPAWVWTKHPECRFLTGSHALDLATRDCRKARVLLGSEWYVKLWSSNWSFQSDENKKSSYENDKGGFRNIFSINGHVTGFRGDERLIDDPHDASNSYNDDALKKDCEWFDLVFSTRSDPLKPSKTLIIMQRLSRSDLTEHILSKKPEDWVHICLPLEYEPDRKCITILGEDPRTLAGEYIWGDKTPFERIDKLKVLLGSDGVAGQLQQRPNKPGGNIVKEAWFQRFYFKDLPKLDYILMSLDSAWETKNENDFSVITVWGVRGNNIYLLHMWRAKVEVYDLERISMEIYTEYSHFDKHAVVEKFLIEDKSSGTAIKQRLKKYTLLPILETHPKDKKEVRLHAVTPILEAKLVFLPYERDFVSIFLDEVISFPKGKNDDIIDSMSQALLYIQQKSVNAWFALCN